MHVLWHESDSVGLAVADALPHWNQQSGAKRADVRVVLSFKADGTSDHMKTLSIPEKKTYLCKCAPGSITESIELAFVYRLHSHNGPGAVGNPG
jgi:hypothetical protein